MLNSAYATGTPPVDRYSAYHPACVRLISRHHHSSGRPDPKQITSPPRWAGWDRRRPYEWSSSRTRGLPALCVLWSAALRRVGHRERQDGLTGMQPVLGFLINDRLRAIDHLVGNLVAAVSGKAVHVESSGRGERHASRIAYPVPVGGRLRQRLGLARERVEPAP